MVGERHHSSGLGIEIDRSQVEAWVFVAGKANLAASSLEAYDLWTGDVTIGNRQGPGSRARLLRLEHHIDLAGRSYRQRRASVLLRKITGGRDTGHGNGRVTNVGQRDGVGRAESADYLPAKIQIRGGMDGTSTRVQNHWGERRLVEIEAISCIVGVAVSLGQGSEAESVLDKLQHGCKFILRMRDVTGLGIGRNDEERHPRPQPENIYRGHLNVIVETTEIVPGEKHGGGIPIRPLHE